jgi:hypothetical protein
MLPDKSQWTHDFLQSAKFKEILTEVEKIRSKKIVIDFDGVIEGTLDPFYTPRRNELEIGIVHIQPYYILDYISKMNDKTIYDIGCGFNFFKKFYNIIGIDPIDPRADITDTFNEDFVEKNRSSFSNVFSINAIHFCKLSNLEKNVIGYFDLVEPGGYAYLAINTEMIFQKTFENTIGFRSRLLEKLYPEGVAKGIGKIFEKILDNTTYDVIFYENKIDSFSIEPINGNIRILIKRMK